MLSHRAIPATADRGRICSFLGSVFAPTDVFEVRVLGLPLPKSLNLGSASGWFKGAQLELAADSIVHFASTANGVYVTPQILRPEIYRRQAGRPVVVKKNADATKRPAPTCDQDVISHRYLIIDIDPVKAEAFKKHSATDAEKQSSWDVADKVRSFFAGHRWADPLVGDSGNGYHLYYRIPVAGSDAICSTQLHALLHSLSAKFDTTAAAIDTKVFNPARIMKVLGAPSRKGPNTAARPHRGSSLIGVVPSDWSPTRYSPPGGTPAPTDIADLILELPRPASSIKPVSVPAISVINTRNVDGDAHKLARRVRAWIAAGPPAISGQGGHNRTFEVAQALVNGFCLARDEAISFLMSEFVPMSPVDDRWDLHEIEHKVDEAIRKPCDKRRGWLLNASLSQSSSPLTTSTHAAVVMTDEEEKTAGESTVVPNRALPSIVQQPAQLHDVVDQAIAALVAANDPMSVFVHGDSLVRIDAIPKIAVVKNLSKAQLRLLVSKAARWMNESTTKEGETVRKATFPKSEVIESIQDHSVWPGLPRLTAVADVPVITAESGMLTKPGFDAASGVYLLSGGYADVPAVADKPTSHDVEIARSLIMDDLLGDFPFADDASKANALALFLLPFVRGLVDGPTPLHHVDAPQEGTGKSLLIQTWGWVTLGHEPKALGEVSRPDDWQKLILAALIEAPREIFLDNLNQTLDSGSLASALTSTVIGGRLLGFSRMVSAPVNCVWVSSGNNVSMSRELVRRTVYIRLDAKQDTAWQGRKFKHKLPQWAKKVRGDLVWACLTLCQAWVAAGKVAGRSLLGGFEPWAAVMDGILSNAGIGDLVGNMDAFRNTSVESGDEWRAFVPVWWREFNTMKVTAGELAQLADRENKLISLIKDATTDRQRGAKLAHPLSRIKDRFYGNLQVKFSGHDHSGTATYRIVEASSQTETPQPSDGVVS